MQLVAITGFGVVFFFQAEDGIRDLTVTGVQTCALPISSVSPRSCAPSWRGSQPLFSAFWVCGTSTPAEAGDRKSTRLNSSHSQISYAVFCLKKKNPICLRLY